MQVLLVEDSSEDAKLIERKISATAPGEISIHRVSRLQAALECLAERPWDGILLDLGLPDSQGLETIQTLREADCNTPVIALTGLCDESVALQAAAEGAHDYLDKNMVTGPLLVRSLSYVRERFRLLQQIQYQTTHDPLTGLYNRHKFEGLIEQAIGHYEQTGELFGVLLLDLDRFKLVNDLAGHDCGNELLADLGWRLKRAIGQSGHVARLGGDEFALLLENSCNAGELEELALRIHECLKAPFDVDGFCQNISASIGAVHWAGDARNNSLVARADLMRNVDMAMYAAKHAGPGKTRLFDDDLKNSLIENARLEQALQNAMDNAELLLHFQPIVNLRTSQPVAFEALCRWNSPELGSVSPGVFIPLAERLGLICEIGRWVIKTACHDFAAWKDAQTVPPSDMAVHVNVSAMQLSDSQLIPTIEAALRSSGLTPEEVTIEVTESSLADNTEHARQTLREIRGMGLGLSIDDFGVGFSSLEQLRRFPFSSLKIDQTFVAELDDPSGEPAIFLEAITTLASGLGLSTIAEGIETPRQLKLVSDAGCDFAQGFHVGYPAAMAEIISGNHEPRLRRAVYASAESL